MNKCLTIITNDKQSLNALSLFFDSMRINSPHLYNQSWHVIYPKGFEIPNSIIDADGTGSIRCIPYVNIIPQDRYAMKFAIKDFLKNECCDEDIFLYMDTDHIFLNELELEKPKDKEIFFSSEKHTLSVKNHGAINHYNASLIYGQTSSLKIIVDDWFTLYQELDDNEVGRFKEEVAMAIAADRAGLCVNMVNSTVQSNFQSFDCNCACFHYGGDYAMAKNIKKYLGVSDLF